MARVLVVDRDEFTLDALSEALGRAGHAVETATKTESALDRLREERYEFVVAGLNDASCSAAEFVARAQVARPGVGSVLVGEPTTFDDAIDALRAGALDYLTKPFHVDDLVKLVARHCEGAVAQRAARDEPAAGRAGDPRVLPLAELIGRDPAMRRVAELVAAVAPAQSAVLVRGERGTGKARVAEAIHAQSGRRAAAFVTFNCAAHAESMVEAELFGAEEGALSPGARGRLGCLRRAQGGTLFLEEVGSLPLPAQVKLLRALQNREVQPVGSEEPVRIDVRVVASTESDLQAEVRAGRFREDLLFRLAVIPIDLPPLRARSEDVAILASRLLARHAAQSSKSVGEFTERAAGVLTRYPWPGNVRELENAVERAVVLTAGPKIDVDDLPPEVRGARAVFEQSLSINTLRLADVEEAVIRRVLALTGWNIKRSAEILGVTRATLYSKIRKLGLAATR